MEGSNIKDARNAMTEVIKMLCDNTFFNIIGFGSSFESLFPEPVLNSRANVDIALKHIQNLNADLGGTELSQPLTDIFT